ncbi:MAG: hypothetical protein SCALA702_06610 [Melioribacteraceae bacterium]|nr:MAG: hypothetical protein SCALA702_06610 [Melioribacteraceae bacterium]
MPYNPYDPEKSDFIPVLSPVAAAITGLIFIFFTYQIVGGLITLALFGFDLENAPVNGFRFMTSLGQFLFILAPALLLSHLVYRNITDIIRIKLPGWKEIAVFVAGMLIIIPLMQELVTVQNYIIDVIIKSVPVLESVKAVFDELSKTLEGTYLKLISADNLFELSWVVFIIAFTPAICEEVLFRGFIQKSFEFRMKPLWAAVITSIFFGMYHFNPFGLFALILLSFYIGFSAYKSDSIFIPMILHFLNNFITVSVFYALGDTELLDPTAVPEGEILYSVINVVLLSVLFIFFLYIVNKNYHKIKGGNDDMSEV